MSKRFMFLIGVIIFFSIASRWYWEKQQLVKPIVIDTRVDLERRLIEVSYIVNREETTRLESVNLGDETFYPIGSNINYFSDTIPVNDIQEFTYYAIRSEGIKIEDDEYENLVKNSKTLNEGTVSFFSYAPINVKPTIITESIDNFGSLLTSFEADGDGKVRVILEPKTNLVIDHIKIIHPTATYEKIAELPLIFEEGQKLEIQLDHVFKFFRYGYLDVILSCTDNDRKIEERYLTNFDDIATEKFIRAYVKGANNE